MKSKAERLVRGGSRVKVVCGERHADSDSGVVVDTLRATFKQDAARGVILDVAGADSKRACRLVAAEVSGLLGFNLGEGRAGRDYYESSHTIVNSGGFEVGSVSAGGERQRGTVCVSLKGEACCFASAGWEARIHSLSVRLGARLTRIDLALDFFSGELTVDEAKDCYLAGEMDFQSRRPSCDQNGDWINGQHRTFYVGRRESGKLLRVYEKGHKFGNLSDPWVRAEVEFQAKDRVIPLDALIRPSAFFAGAYPFCALLLSRVTPERIQTGRAVGQASGERLVRWVEHTVAPALVAAVRATGSSDWLTDLVWKHSERPAPRSVRGLSDEVRDSEITAALGRAIGSISGVGPSDKTNLDIQAGDVPF